MYTVMAICKECDGSSVLEDIREEDWETFMKGELVQRVWPDKSADEREILIGARTGYFICTDCWDEVFNDAE